MIHSGFLENLYRGEFHSVYPPLTLARAYGKELAGRGPLGKLAGIIRLSRSRALSRARESQPVLKAALHAAVRSEALFRSLLSMGLRRYGSRLATHEFLLRRMTHLSLSLFWLTARVPPCRGKLSASGLSYRAAA